MSFVDPSLHQHYSPLRESDAGSNPFDLFKVWYQYAIDSKVDQPEAMTLATATPDGIPSARMVLLRGFDEQGFVFFTNYESRKSQEIHDNPVGALLFFWQPLDRQVRVEGKLERTTPEESDAYFQTRPRGSRIGAWASPQSRVLDSRDDLERRFAKVIEEYGEEGPVPRPSFWGGYRVIPNVIEFWQGGDNRLHDRIRFKLEDQVWVVERLAP